MIRNIGESIGNAIFENLGRAAGRVQEKKPLPVDLLESDDAYLALFDVPGATASDIQVRYIDDRVAIRVDRFREFYDGYDMRYPGRGVALDGEVTLPEDAVVDAEAASATLNHNGTLQVRLPKHDHETHEGESDESADSESESGADGDEQES